METEHDELNEERIPWHPAFMENEPDGTHIPEIRETEEEKAFL